MLQMSTSWPCMTWPCCWRRGRQLRERRDWAGWITQVLLALAAAAQRCRTGFSRLPWLRAARANVLPRAVDYSSVL